jgi:hypothetical protein
MKTLALLQKITIVLTVIFAVFLMTLVVIAFLKRAKAPKAPPAPLAVVIKPSLPVPSRPVQRILGGGIITLVGISDDEAAMRRWWSMSGRPLRRLPIVDPSVPTKLSRISGPVYRTVFIARDLPRDASLSLDVPIAPATSWTVHSESGRRLIFSIDAVVPSVFLSIDEHVGLDGGDWLTLATHRVQPGDTGGMEYGVRPDLGNYAVAISPITDISGHAAFTIQSSENARIDCRIVAVDNSGHATVGRIVNSAVATNGESTSINQNVVFDTVPTKDIQLIKVQYRVFHFVEFDNIPLKPAKSPPTGSDDWASASTAAKPRGSASAEQIVIAPLARVSTPRSLLVSPAQWHQWLSPKQPSTAPHSP